MAWFLAGIVGAYHGLCRGLDHNALGDHRDFLATRLAYVLFCCTVKISHMEFATRHASTACLLAEWGRTSWPLFLKDARLCATGKTRFALSILLLPRELPLWSSTSRYCATEGAWQVASADRDGSIRQGACCSARGDSCSCRSPEMAYQLFGMMTRC